MRTYIGIDPGSKGYITIYNAEKGNYHISIADHSFSEIGMMLGRVKEKYPDVFAVMEEVHAVYGSSARGTFSFGEVFGLLQGLLIATKIPYHLVQPKEWQKEIWINADKVFKTAHTIDTKATSLNAAERLFPGYDFKRTPACKKADDNKVDSMLICEFAKRKNL